ncbi:hypothetical protein COT77_00915 [Candidatus Berkelbacteria bacterium CG10_big_fil_rev_8_21_14_0_10_41_12]|uniref:LytR/CpsA/Psr regulator C-terminal domain-containing protein n=1 Tax=Candidatus Berkelbacteria bacterium CG10_big_fil_rev_8_21_14_0_10_41_12 TaxID=1974513 RepID=A0A2M6WXJ7_9BACT|nr:MAG: hypothetical protein COT77_00915 [Candidatus Berkelbacteria bacterium CG10_big_fil_rev_8_21_14_0_10_41_12]
MVKQLDIMKPERSEDDPSEQEYERVHEHRSDEFITTNEKRSGGYFYLVLGIIAIVVSVAASLFVLYQDKLPSIFGWGKNTEESPTATVAATGTISPTASSTTEASSATSSTPNMPSTDYSSKIIRVVNGNGVNGEASRIASILKSNGFNIKSTDNAKRSYSTTTIYYKSSEDSGLANAIKGSLPSEYSNAEIAESSTITGANYDCVVALGSQQ